jgi:hypothetical protein
VVLSYSGDGYYALNHGPSRLGGDRGAVATGQARALRRHPHAAVTATPEPTLAIACPFAQTQRATRRRATHPLELNLRRRRARSSR